MCEPISATTMFLLATATAVAGGVVAYQGSKNSQEYNEKVADVNKKTVEAQAQDQERLGQLQQAERRTKTRMQIATQQVGFGAQNVEQTGTALDILGDTAMFGEIDSNRIAANAARAAFGFRSQGYNIEADKRLGAYRGKMERVGTILSTASAVGGAFGNYAGASAAGGAKPFGAPATATANYYGTGPG